MKFLLHAVFIILLALVTFFGFGPVLLADGIILERLWTSAIVIVIYFVIVFIYRKAVSWANKR
ncbi:hypothetical protein QNH20_20495 [Neobacillus sp. WH10]|uniref:DUF6954 family protein n=1 Tax=Neobacillus sp. WH10 TaxID=3047873 RepID=UPI0024C16FDB|nr:hypothetical protein [Neobacillus sp. WH10]WHY76475.1 hypothetical protein QNH20_20495 [Neobacillus sp. WH10]